MTRARLLRISTVVSLAFVAIGCERKRPRTPPDPQEAAPAPPPEQQEGDRPAMAPHQKHDRPRIPADQQIGLIEACEQARSEAVHASPAEREQAVSRWIAAIQRGQGLCTNDLHEALVMKDDENHEVALQVLLRTDWREHEQSFLSDLESERLSPEQRARVFACLKAVSGKDFGDDRAAWQAWLRGQP